LVTCGDNCYLWSGTLATDTYQYSQRLGGVAHSGVIEFEWAGDSNSSALPSFVTLYRVEGENRFGTNVYTMGQPTPIRTSFSADATNLELKAFYYDGGNPGEVFTFKVSGFWRQPRSCPIGHDLRHHGAAVMARVVDTSCHVPRGLE
jgi:hypothetical protein